MVAMAWQTMMTSNARTAAPQRQGAQEPVVRGFDVEPSSSPGSSPQYPSFPPTPSFAHAGEASSQAMRQAASAIFASSRQAPQQNLHQRGLSSPAGRSSPGSRSSSGEDVRAERIHSRSSGYNSWGEGSAFEKVDKEDAAGFDATQPERPRPSGRGSSWFGWTGATPPKGKTD